MDDIKFRTGLNVEPVVASETAIQRSGRAALRRRQRAGARATASGKAHGPGQQGARGPEPRRRQDEIAGRRRRRRDRRGLAREAERRSPGHPAGERAVPGGHPARRQRHSHRALRKRTARPVPHRRRAAVGDDAAAEVPRPARLAHQDHGAARHLREAPAAGRPHQGALQRSRHEPRDRLPCVGAADALRRKDRAPPAGRQGPAARHEPARASTPRRSRRFDRAIRKPWGMVLVTGPTGSGKTNTLYSALVADQPARREHHDRRGPGRIQPAAASTRCRSRSRSA